MKRHSRPMPGESVWAHSERIAMHPELRVDTSVDVCVIGAGITGLTVAYLLAEAGKKVIVLEDGRIAGGQTEVTSAHLSNVLDRRYYEIIEWRGQGIAELAAASHAAAIDEIESITQRERLDCDFRRLEGYLFAAPGDSHDAIEREWDAMRGLGVLKVERAKRVPWPKYNTGPCLRFANQGQFHPLKYLAGLSLGVERLGGRICCKTHAASVVGGESAHVTTAEGIIVMAEDVVVATNTPINDLLTIHTKQAPYITYVVGAKLPASAIPQALYWDTDSPYHYVRIQPSEDTPDQVILLVGGEDHKTGQADDGNERFGRLEQWARERFPEIEEIPYRWSGQVMESIDGLGFIGRNPGDEPNVFIATGDSGLGMTHGTIAGLLLRDLILGNENPWTEVYNPSRTPPGTAVKFLGENLNVATQYLKWLTPGEIASADDLKPGHGGILRSGLEKVAVYRDKDGNLTKLSAVCPHLKCAVAWNSTESTWDCPCHGSRFDSHGTVLNGPANHNLTEWQGDKK